jgi:glycosyltransferase involved in cell wall biosynthesis
MKKILHLITSLKMGGAETLLCDLLERADTRDVNYAVIYFHEGPNVARLQNLGIPAYHIKGLVCFYDPIFFLRLFLCVYKLRPSLIHTWLWSANIAGRLAGLLCRVPVINSFHNNVDQDGSLRALFDRVSYGMAHELVAVSHGVADSLKMHYNIQPARITTIQNGIDYELVRKRAEQYGLTRADLGLTDDHFIIGSVGRFVFLKNYSLLLAAFSDLYAAYPHARLVLVGSGTEEQQLRDLAAELGISHVVHFVIGKPSYGYYPLFDCFALSSFKEGISIALLEAMCFALPCISTHEKVTHDVITNDVNGLLVPSENKAALVAGLTRIMADKEQASQWGKNALATVKDVLSLDSMKKSYEMVYAKHMKVNENY